MPLVTKGSHQYVVRSNGKASGSWDSLSRPQVRDGAEGKLPVDAV